MAKKKMTLEEKLEEAIVKDVPYEVPENWGWIKFGTVCKLSNGYAFKSTKYRENGVPILRISNIQEFGINFDEKTVYSDYDETLNRYYVDKGDLLIAMSGATTGKTGVYNEDKKAYLNQRVGNIKIEQPELITEKFRNYIISYKEKEILDLAYGGAQPNISTSMIEGLSIPLPPLKEQQRIVDKIESLFEKLDKANELIEEARDDFEKRKSAMLEKAFRGELTKEWRSINKNKILDKTMLFNKIKEVRFSLITSNKERKEIESLFNDYKYINQDLPDGWIKLKSSMVCELISCGKTPTGSIVDKGEVAYLKVYNIVNNKIDFEYKPQFIDYETHSTKLKSSMLRPNDVIMNIVGPPLKKIAIIPETYKDWNMNQALVRFRTIDCIDYKYFYYCLLYDDTLRDVVNATRGVVGQANISVSQSRNLDIIVPSLEEQLEIVRILDKLLEEEAKIEELTQLEEQIELIKKSILAKAFRGQLGTNSEEDESALELLKEILKKE